MPLPSDRDHQTRDPAGGCYKAAAAGVQFAADDSGPVARQRAQARLAASIAVAAPSST